MNINNETPAALEAILFACGGPVAFDRLCEILGIGMDGLREAANILKNKYSAGASPRPTPSQHN